MVRNTSEVKTEVPTKSEVRDSSEVATPVLSLDENKWRELHAAMLDSGSTRLLRTFDALAAIGLFPVPLRRSIDGGKVKAPAMGPSWGAATTTIAARRDFMVSRSPAGIGVQPVGLVVIDVDCPDKDAGKLKETVDLATDLLGLVDTFSYATSSGVHFWYICPPAVAAAWKGGRKTIELANGGQAEFFHGHFNESGQMQVACAPSEGKRASVDFKMPEMLPAEAQRLLMAELEKPERAATCPDPAPVEARGPISDTDAQKLDYIDEMMQAGHLDAFVDDYNDWVTVAKQLYGLAGGLEVWLAWSSRSSKFNERNARYRWGKQQGARHNLKTLLGWLGQAGAPLFKDWLRDKRGPERASTRRGPAQARPDDSGQQSGQNASTEGGSPSGHQWAGDGGAVPREREYIKVVKEFKTDTHDHLQRVLVPHLSAAGAYRRGGQLVRVRTVTNDTTMIDGVAVNGPTVDIYTAGKLTVDITKAVVFEYYDAKEKTWYPGGVDPNVMASVLGMSDWPSVPLLNGITSGPFIRPDGTVCDTGGYDAASGYYLNYSGGGLNVPANPTSEQVKASLDMLLDLVGQFEWSVTDQTVGKVSPSVVGWLAYLLTLVARPAINGPVPAFVLNATSKGSGKTTLAAIANIIAFGATPSVTEMPTGDRSGEEIRKMMFSFAVSGSPSILIDNWQTGGRVGGATLDYYATATSVTNRVLGATKTETAPWRAVLSIGGNALSVTSDFSDRCVWISLEPTVDKPRDRVPAGGFKYSPIQQHAADNREKYLRAALTILRGHFANNLPKPDGVRNWGTFENWAKIVRDPLMTLTGVDLRASLDVAEVEDAEASEFSTLISGLLEFQNNFGGRKWRIGDLYRAVNVAASAAITPGVDGGLYANLHSIMDFSLTQFQFSRKCIVAKYVNRVWNGHVIKRHPFDKDTFTYLVERLPDRPTPEPDKGESVAVAGEEANFPETDEHGWPTRPPF